MKVLRSFLMCMFLGGFCYASEESADEQISKNLKTSRYELSFFSSEDSEDSNSTINDPLSNSSSGDNSWFGSNSSQSEEKLEDFQYSTHYNRILLSLHNSRVTKEDSVILIRNKNSYKVYLKINRDSAFFVKKEKRTNIWVNNIILMNDPEKLIINTYNLGVIEIQNIKGEGSLESWKSAFQKLVHRRSLWEQLFRLVIAFEEAATDCVKLIVAEHSWPAHRKTIVPTYVSGDAGGEKYTAHDIFFKFARDVRIAGKWVYGGTSPSFLGAAKNAGQEGVASNVLANYSFVEEFQVPLTMTIDYRGFRVTAKALIPRKNHTLVYGSEDGGKIFVNYDKRVEKFVTQFGLDYHLRPHMVTSQQRVSVCGDIEIHRCPVSSEKSIYYCLDLARLFPPTCERKTQLRIYFENFRPEFCKQQEYYLSTDAFTGFQHNDPDMTSMNQDIVKATIYLKKTVVPSYVQKILKEKQFGSINQSSNYKGLSDRLQNHYVSKHLILHMHKHGINLRYLGEVYKLIPKHSSRKLRKFIFTTMTTRVLKNYTRSLLRKNRSKYECEETIVNMLNRLCGGSMADSKAFYSTEIPKLIAEKYGIESLQSDIDQLDVGYLVAEYCHLMGVKVESSIVRKFYTATLQAKIFPNKLKFEFCLSDIVSFNPTIKKLNSIDLIRGWVCFQKGNELGTKSKAGRDLLKNAYESLHRASLNWGEKHPLAPQNLKSILAGLEKNKTKENKENIDRRERPSLLQRKRKRKRKRRTV